MNRQDFETYFSEGTAEVGAWAKEHGKATTGIVCFALGFIAHFVLAHL